MEPALQRGRWRRPRLLLGLLLLAFVAGAMTFWVFLTEDRISPAGVHRVKKGASKAEVEAILGPPRDYQATEAKFWDTGETASEAGTWWGSGYMIEVYFDQKGKVVRRQGATAVTRNPLIRIKRRIMGEPDHGIVTD